MLSRLVWLAAVAAAVWPVLTQPGSAATLTRSAFSYDGRSVILDDQHEADKGIQAGWNPRVSKDNPNVLSPGFHVSFFGRGAGCIAAAANGPVTRLPADLAARAVAVTGVPYRPSQGDLSWAPAAEPVACPTAAHLPPGPAFVLVHRGSPGAVGLFTHVGDGDRIPGPHFWRQFSTQGQNAGGANAYIEGTFTAWRFSWRGKNAVRPWGMSGRGHGGVPRVLIRITQSVAAASAPTASRGSQAAQVKQQYSASFINPACQMTMKVKKTCQVGYLFHTALIRGGGIVWRDQAWANHAQLLFDPTQGGTPIFYGPLKPPDQVTTAGSIDLWRSRGNATEHGTFGSRVFAAEISFPEFLNGLRVIAARSLATTPDRVADRQLAALFGETWNDPAGWVLLATNVGQEVYNKNIGQEAYIGGAFTNLEIRAEAR